MWFGRALNLLAPKLARANLKSYLDSINPLLLAKRVSLVDFSGINALSMIGTKLLLVYKMIAYIDIQNAKL
mgnify:CR=1 FL=1